jgi:threonine dehydrogenase-like Zn-dependent dehydrogenase
VTESVLAAVRTGPARIELKEFPMPDIPDDAALLRMEVAGICGTDVKMYEAPRVTEPVIMGHENVGVIAKAGRKFTELKGMGEGDRVFVEHYVACFRCEWCHQGEYRHCWATDWRHNPDALRYGYTPAARPPHLWGGFAEYLYLPWNAVVHRVPDGVSAELAGIATPLSNGIEWALFDCQVGFNSSVLIQGPGQQGLSQVVACRQAGASTIVVTGTSRDAARMEVAMALGADVTIDVEREDAAARVAEITGGDGVDVVIDCTAGAGTAPITLGIQALKRKAGTLLIQGELDEFPGFPIRELTEKAITIKSARGHSYKACELALQQLASKRFPLDLLTTHTFGLDQVDLAIRSVGGRGEADVIHVSLLPGRDARGGHDAPAGSRGGI